MELIKPDIFLVGGPKTGSTSLHYYLSQHPDIFMTDDKEPHYFCDDLHKESDKFHGEQKYFRIRTKEQYNSRYKDHNGEMFSGEASTTYLYSKNAAKNIYRVNPNAKIIAILREPIEMAYSWWNWEIYRSHETENDFENALSLESKRKEDKNLIPKNADFPSCVFYSEIVAHYSNLKRYYDLFSKDQIHIILYDDYKNNLETEYNKVLNFLGVESFSNVDFGIKNQSRSVRFPKLKYILDKVILDRVKMNLYEYRNTPILKKAKKIYLNVLSEKKSRPSLNIDILEKLRPKFHDEVSQCSELLQIDLLKKWNYE